MKQLILDDNKLNLALPSIFLDGKKIEGNNTGEIWMFLRQIFLEMGEKSGDKLYIKHMELQNILVEYSYNQPLEKYLDNSGYTLVHRFNSLDELKYYLMLNKELRGNIKSGRYNIGLHYAGTTPVAIVLAEKNGKPQIQDASLQSRLAVDDIVGFPNI